MASEAEAIEFEARITEALIPDENVLGQIRETGSALKEIILQAEPDFLMTTGGSSVVTRLLLHQINRGLERKVPVLRIGRLDNALFYKLMYTDSSEQEEIPEEERLERLSACFEKLKQEHPGLTHDSKIMIVDEYLNNGIKALATLARMRQLGYQEVSFVALTTSGAKDLSDPYAVEETLYEIKRRRPVVFQQLYELARPKKTISALSESILIVSRDGHLYSYLRDLAKEISRTKTHIWRAEEPLPILQKAEPRIRAALTETLRRIGKVEIS